MRQQIDRSSISIFHFDWRNEKRIETKDYIPKKEKLDIILTSGASCPDIVVEKVLKKLLGYFSTNRTVNEVVDEIEVTV